VGEEQAVQAVQTASGFGQGVLLVLLRLAFAASLALLVAALLTMARRSGGGGESDGV
jgi:hypothetical protein